MKKTSINFELPTLDCKRCTHHWFPRTTKDPLVCPSCKSPYWNIPRGSTKLGRPPKKTLTAGERFPAQVKVLDRMIRDDEKAARRSRRKVKR